MSHLEPQVEMAFPNLALEDQLLPSMLEREITKRPALSENQCEEQRELNSLHVFHKDLCKLSSGYHFKKSHIIHLVHILSHSVVFSG